MTNSRNGIFAVLPGYGVGNSAPVLLTSHRESESFLLGCLNSFASDYVIRQKIPGGNLNFFIVNQFTCLQPHGPHIQEWGRWVSHRVLELTYSAWDLEPFAQDCGYDGPPFRWDEERRFLLRCELDAAFLHLYLPAAANGEWRTATRADGCPHDETPEQLAELKNHFPTPRDAVAYIMDTFPIVKRRDEAAHGTYRTKDTILAIYDEMAEVIAKNAAALATGREPTAQYQTRLNPPPGPPCDTNGNFIPMAQWDPNHWPAHIHAPREGLPLTVPLETRIAASNPGIYTAQLILWLLKQSGGRCERVRLARAFALLSRPDWLLEVAPEAHKAVAGQWRQSFNETGYDGMFRQALAPMLGAEVVLRRDGESVYAELAQPERLLDRPWIAFDARLALAVLDSLPASILASTPMEQARQEAERVLMAG